MTARFLFSVFLILVSCNVQAQGTSQKRYPLSGHGVLVMAVPSGWTEQVQQESKMPPTISYTVAGAKQQVIITPVWRVRADVPPFTQESVRKNVEHAVGAAKDEAVEKELRVTEFKGKSGTGYYFEATDKAPKPGEFKFLRQGMLMIGDMLLAFTVLADSRDEPVMGQAMRMLQGAAHAPK